MHKQLIKQSILFLAIILTVISCGERDKKNSSNNDKTQITKRVTTTQPAELINETWTIYFRQDTLCHVKRLVTRDNKLHLLTYDINTSKPENTEQIFIQDKQLTDLSEGEKLKSGNSKYNWSPYKMPEQTLFVQIEPSAFKDEMDALDRRQKIEQEIATALKFGNNGEWTAGDLGPGGGKYVI